jgi:hypothetical protein
MMSWTSSLKDWFSQSSSLHNVTAQIDAVIDEVSSAMSRHAVIALLIGVAVTDVAQAQTKNGGEPVTVPVIEAIEQEEVEDVYRQAKTINEDQSFDPMDVRREIHHAKDLIEEFKDVGEEIEMLIDEGQLTEATMLLKSVTRSIDNMSKDFTRLLASAKQADGDKDIISGLETLTEDIISLRDNVDVEQNRLAKAAGALKKMKKEIKDDPNVTYEEKDGKFVMRITKKASKLSDARDDAVSLLEDYIGGTGLQGETYVDTDIPGGDKKIEATAVTTITYD